MLVLAAFHRLRRRLVRELDLDDDRAWLITAEILCRPARVVAALSS
jgi:hypothetical protein